MILISYQELLVMKEVEDMTNINEKIKESVSNFIQKRLIVSRELQSKKYREEELFDLDSYVTLSNQYENLLRDLYKRHENGEDITIEKDGEEMSMIQAVRSLKKNFRNEKSSKVQMSDSNIKDIITLINRYFDIADISKNAECCNENFFLRGVLCYIRDNDPNQVNRDLAERYIPFFYAQDYAGFDKKISGRVSFGYQHLISLSSCDDKVLFKVDEDSNIVIEYDENKDYFLLGKDIIFGLMMVNGKETLVSVIKTFVDGKFKYIPFVYNDEFYEETDTVCDDKIKPYKTLKELLDEQNLSDYYEDVYCMRDFIEILDLIRGKLLLNDKDLERIEKMSEVAADWWINIADIKDSKVEEEDSDDNNLNTKYTSDRLVQFRRVFISMIRKQLIIRGGAYLSVDYAPNYDINKCLEKTNAKKYISFPWKTNMIVEENKILIKKVLDLSILYMNMKKRRKGIYNPFFYGIIV